MALTVTTVQQARMVPQALTALMVLTVQTGTDGAPGADGAPGTDGIDGGPGMDGTDGTDGMDGATGDTGPAGADGAGAAPVQDEGTQVVATPSAFNFVGDGVAVTDVSGVATVTVPGGGVGGGGATITVGVDNPGLIDFAGEDGDLYIQVDADDVIVAFFSRESRVWQPYNTPHNAPVTGQITLANGTFAETNVNRPATGSVLINVRCTNRYAASVTVPMTHLDTVDAGVAGGTISLTTNVLAYPLGNNRRLYVGYVAGNGRILLGVNNADAAGGAATEITILPVVA